MHFEMAKFSLAKERFPDRKQAVFNKTKKQMKAKQLLACHIFFKASSQKVPCCHLWVIGFFPFVMIAEDTCNFLHNDFMFDNGNIKYLAIQERKTPGVLVT